MKFVDKNLRYRVCGVTVIQSYNAFKCKCKFSMVRKEQHGKCHILLLLQNDSPETGPQGIYKYTDSCLWHEKYWFPIRSHPCSSLQSAAEKNLLNVMKQGKKQTNKKKSTKTSEQKLQQHRNGQHILLLSLRFRKSRWGSERRDSECLRHCVLQSRQKHELTNDLIFETQ